MTAKQPPSRPKPTLYVPRIPCLSAKDMVAKAKAAGIALTDTYVYNVRGAAKAAASKAKPAPVKAPVAHAVAKSGASAGSVESLLKAVAAEIGLGRAFEILVGERARVQAVLGA